MTDRIDTEKRRIRGLVRTRRAGLDEHRIDTARNGLAAGLSRLARDHGARTVSCYLPVANEPDTRGFLAWARAAGVRALLPSSRADGLLDWIEWGDEGEAAGAFGIPEPLGPRLGPEALAEVDLMLVPACAVDRSGTRLGWGRGYFDRALGALDRRPQVYAVVYGDEVFDELPSEAHDVPVTGAVTPEGVLLF